MKRPRSCWRRAAPRGVALGLGVAGLVAACASAPRQLWVAEFAPGADSQVVWLARGRAEDGEIRLYLARGQAEGGLAWLRQLPDDADPVVVHGHGVRIVEDTVLLSLRRDWDANGPDELTGVHAFALSDGTPRWRDSEGYVGVDPPLKAHGSYGDHHQLLVVSAVDPPGVGGRVRAYGASGVQWTSTLEGDLFLSAEAKLTERYLVLGDRFESESESESEQRWHVIDRRDGSEALMVSQTAFYGFACVSPTLLFLEQPDGIDRVDLRTLEHRRFASLPLPAPPKRGDWRTLGCGVLEDGSLVVEVGTPTEAALARLDASTGALVSMIDTEGFHAAWFPSALPPMLATVGAGDEMDMMGVVDLAGGRLVSQRSVEPRRGWHTFVADGRSWVTTRGRIGVIDPGTGDVAGTRRLGPRWANRDARAVDGAVWVPTERHERPDRLAARVVTLDGLRSTGSRALTRAMVSGRVRPPPMSLMCRMHPARCVQGDGLGISREPLPPVDPAATVPPWDLRAMHRSARRYASAPPHAATALLGWSIVEDDRPLRNHNAVVLVEHRKGKRYSVVTLYRHAVNEAWNIDNSLHSSNRPVVAFDHRPTAAEVEQVLTRNGWQLEGEPEGFAVLAGTMPAATWVEWLGAAPSVTIRVTAVAPDR